ncbi:MAG: helix-turn-helix transcriptional regulator [candidate division Zixibacteria bacterium]|nr:helix-turn-helix transcriptional regulator [candidate division Zixibacteria bacterium]
MKKDILKLLGGKVRDRRIKKGLSQEEFADIAGLDRTYVSGIERGVRNPTVRTLKTIADALDMSISELLEESP